MSGKSFIITFFNSAGRIVQDTVYVNLNLYAVITNVQVISQGTTSSTNSGAVTIPTFNLLGGLIAATTQTVSSIVGSVVAPIAGLAGSVTSTVLGTATGQYVPLTDYLDFLLAVALKQVFATYVDLVNYSIKSVETQTLVACKNYRITFQDLTTGKTVQVVVYINFLNLASITSYQVLTPGTTTTYAAIDVGSLDLYYAAAKKAVLLSHPDLISYSIVQAQMQVASGGKNFIINYANYFSGATAQATVSVTLNLLATITKFTQFPLVYSTAYSAIPSVYSSTYAATPVIYSSTYGINQGITTTVLPLTTGYSAFDPSSTNPAFIVAKQTLLRLHPELTSFSIVSVLSQVFFGYTFKISLSDGKGNSAQATIYVDLFMNAYLTSFSNTGFQPSSLFTNPIYTNWYRLLGLATVQSIQNMQAQLQLQLGNSFDLVSSLPSATPKAITSLGLGTNQLLNNAYLIALKHRPALRQYSLVSAQPLNTGNYGYGLTYKNGKSLIVSYVRYSQTAAPSCSFYGN